MDFCNPEWWRSKLIFFESLYMLSSISRRFLRFSVGGLYGYTKSLLSSSLDLGLSSWASDRYPAFGWKGGGDWGDDFLFLTSTLFLVPSKGSMFILSYSSSTSSEKLPWLYRDSLIRSLFSRSLLTAPIPRPSSLSLSSSRSDSYLPATRILSPLLGLLLGLFFGTCCARLGAEAFTIGLNSLFMGLLYP